MGAFASAVNVLHRDPTLGAVWTFTAPPAAPVSVHVYWAQHDEPADFPGLTVQVRSPGRQLHVLQEEVPVRPRTGTDTLSDGTTMWTIHDVTEDAERLEWRLDLNA